MYDIKFNISDMRILRIDKYPPPQSAAYFAFDSNSSHAWHNFISVEAHFNISQEICISFTVELLGQELCSRTNHLCEPRREKTFPQGSRPDPPVSVATETSCGLLLSD